MTGHLTNRTWHLPAHENLPDAREHDLATRDCIDHDLQLLQ